MGQVVPSVTGFELVAVVLVAILLFAGIRVFRLLVRAAQMAPSTRDRLARAGPLVELLVWITFIATAMAWLLEGHRVATGIAVGVLLIAAAAAAWFAIRDYLAGVLLRTEPVCRVGDHVALGEVVGVVTQLGLRVLEVRQADGEEVVVPWSRVAASPLARRGGRTAAWLHTFQLELPAELEATDTTDTLVRAARLCHHLPPAGEPTVRATGDGGYRVTLPCWSPRAAAAAEQVVRAAGRDLAERAAAGS